MAALPPHLEQNCAKIHQIKRNQLKTGNRMDTFLFCLMAAGVIPANNPFMSWNPLANVPQKSFRHFLLISQITLAPVKGVYILVLLLKDYLISEHTFVPGGNRRRRYSWFTFWRSKCKTKLPFNLNLCESNFHSESICLGQQASTLKALRAAAAGGRHAVWIPWEP